MVGILSGVKSHQLDVNLIPIMLGSSNGRGPECAGWMQDYLNEVGGASMSSISHFERRHQGLAEYI